jgi:hypothetical protein
MFYNKERKGTPLRSLCFELNKKVSIVKLYVPMFLCGKIYCVISSYLFNTFAKRILNG